MAFSDRGESERHITQNAFTVDLLPRALIPRVVVLASLLAAPSKAVTAEIAHSPSPIGRQLNVCLTDLAVL